MAKHLKVTQTEPVTISAAVLAVVTTVITLAVSFGLDLDPGQQGAIVAAVNAVIILATLIAATRNQVTPKDKVVEQLDGDGDNVVAGRANEAIRTGEIVRKSGRP